MRIRTVKPDFWTHPVMSRQSEATQLIAIGLLNYADDEGYFYADPKLVRAALKPLDEDSTNVRRCLDELSRIGYLETVNHPTHGPIGRIVAFRKHQRIDRPKNSSLKGLYSESTTNRRSVDDESTEEGKGREQGKEGNRDAFGELKARLCSLYSRPATDPWAYIEEHALAEVSRRENALTELELIEKHKTGNSYFPQSIRSLLEKWTEVLDRARVSGGSDNGRPPCPGSREKYTWRGGKWVEKSRLGPNI